MSLTLLRFNYQKGPRLQNSIWKVSSPSMSHLTIPILKMQSQANLSLQNDVKCQVQSMTEVGVRLKYQISILSCMYCCYHLFIVHHLLWATRFLWHFRLLFILLQMILLADFFFFFPDKGYTENHPQNYNWICISQSGVVLDKVWRVHLK